MSQFTVELWSPTHPVCPVAIAGAHLGVRLGQRVNEHPLRYWEPGVTGVSEDVITDSQAELLDLETNYYFTREGCFVVGTCDGLLAGFVGLKPNGPGQAKLKRMAVLPSYRRRGLADSMLTLALDWADENGLNEVSLETNAVWEKAVPLYFSKGFRITGYDDECFLMSRQQNTDAVTPGWFAQGAKRYTIWTILADGSYALLAGNLRLNDADSCLHYFRSVEGGGRYVELREEE
jgi:GNAT superfamily N-acetyltransferase